MLSAIPILLYSLEILILAVRHLLHLTTTVSGDESTETHWQNERLNPDYSGWCVVNLSFCNCFCVILLNCHICSDISRWRMWDLSLGRRQSNRFIRRRWKPSDSTDCRGKICILELQTLVAGLRHHFFVFMNCLERLSRDTCSISSVYQLFRLHSALGMLKSFVFQSRLSFLKHQLSFVTSLHRR